MLIAFQVYTKVTKCSMFNVQFSMRYSHITERLRAISVQGKYKFIDKNVID